MDRVVEFVLPIGYEDDDGMIHREGKMKMATAIDEIEVHNDERVLSSPRFHDVLLLAKIIVNIGEITNVSVDEVLNLYEVDFRYLQTLYKEVNGHLEHDLQVRCPKCNHLDKVSLSSVYKNLDFYFRKEEE